MENESVLFTHVYHPILRHNLDDEITIPLQRRPAKPVDETLLLVRQPEPEELDWAEVPANRYDGPQNATYPNRRQEALAVFVSVVLIILLMVVGMALMLSVFIDDRVPPHIRISSTTR